jgi:hypothetical protein
VSGNSYIQRLPYRTIQIIRLAATKNRSSCCVEEVAYSVCTEPQNPTKVVMKSAQECRHNNVFFPTAGDPYSVRSSVRSKPAERTRSSILRSK